jgi:ADP-dependent NAD(P)H-hydrate dehydratase
MPDVPAEQISAGALRAWPLPVPEGNKGSRGRVLVIGGARSAPGAAMLAGLAALRAGAGVLTLAVADSVAAAAGAAVPESGLIWLPENDSNSIDETAVDALADPVSKADAVLIGPGLDDLEGTERLLVALTEHLSAETPVVLDAYALGALPQLPEKTVSVLAGRLVLTPNSTEAQILAGGKEADDSSELDRLRGVADRFSAVLTCNNTVVQPGGRSWEVPAGHAGLGTSGSGDVLAGAVTGLLARGAELAQATCWGTYLHATAGDRLAAPVGPLGFLAGELLGQLPQILAELRS